ncbi:MAG: carbon monoxide dehydrogenase subunit G [Bauldia sp.]
MDMTGQYRIAAPRSAVWAALNDPAVLKAAIPGCEDLQRLSPNELTGSIRVKVGPVNALFTGWVLLSNVEPESSYRIGGEGSGAASLAKGHADVRLADDEGGTILSYTVTAEVAGRIAQIGSRLIDAAAKKLADDFFASFSRAVGGHDVIRAPAGVPSQHAEPGLPVVEDIAEETAAFAKDAEERIEVAAGQSFLGGPFVWSTVLLIVITLLIVFWRP